MNTDDETEEYKVCTWTFCERVFGEQDRVCGIGKKG